MIIDIGGGTTDIAVISLNGIVTAKNLRVAGDRLSQDIMSYIRDQFKVLVGDKTAEDAKITLASVEEHSESKELIVRGRDVVTGLPREVVITDTDVREAILGSVNTIVESARDVIEKTPPEVLADVMQRGIHLAGGGALIPGVAQLLEEVLKLPVVVVPDPLRAVVRGIGIVLENFELYEELLIQNEEELSPQFQ
jgi:rod shape-determining protein MreB